MSSKDEREKKVEAKERKASHQWIVAGNRNQAEMG
jgi:hypothetical protein